LAILLLFIGIYETRDIINSQNTPVRIEAIDLSQEKISQVAKKSARTGTKVFLD